MSACLNGTDDLVLSSSTVLGSHALSLAVLSSSLGHAPLCTQKIMHPQIDFHSLIVAISALAKPIFDPNSATDPGQSHNVRGPSKSRSQARSPEENTDLASVIFKVEGKSPFSAWTALNSLISY